MENTHLQQPKRKGGKCFHNCAIILHAVVIFAQMLCIGYGSRSMLQYFDDVIHQVIEYFGTYSSTEEKMIQAAI